MQRIMNTWGYLVAIALLLLLAGVMLYARFSSRSSTGALHHQAPGEWNFYPGRISTAPIVPVAAIETEQEAPLRVERPSAAPVEEAAHPERDYLDELQEAAAGLARLMRSSPVTRSEPVVYAPEELHEDAVIDDAVLEEETGVEESVEILEETVADELPLVAAAEIVDEPVVEHEPVTRQVLLGEVVWEQLGKIDDALESLDDLVSSIASGLRMLAGGAEITNEGGTESVGPIAAAA